MTHHAWLCRLLDATTLPPQTDDIDVLLAAFEHMTRDRQALLDEGPRGVPVNSDHADIATEIVARHAAWHTALSAARRRVGEQRRAMTQARRYQRAA